jgi:hypothetical protein
LPGGAARAKLHGMITAIPRPDVTALLARGVQRLLVDHGFAPVLELPLGNGRRADIAALGPKGEVWIVETKSCVADFAVDAKWPDYLAYCDRFYFAVTEQFPQALLPNEAGLIVADAFGGEILRSPASNPLAGARRKALTLAIARLAALRLAAM